ncbi:MAG TPA: DUF721 domain-containing protein [Chthonomonadaceae bacterium]|nr:DUF721 domain-containing protein [Chthonomonadaceae bacterium]
MPSPPANPVRPSPGAENSAPPKSPARNRPARSSTLTIRSGSTTVANALKSAIDGLESASRIRESMAIGLWPRAVGPQAAAATEPEAVRDGVLFVRTKSSVWSQELVFLKADILTKLNRLLGGNIITDLRFRARGVSKAEAEMEPDTPAPEELAAVVLEPAEEAELQARLETLEAMPGERARRTIAARLTTEARLRHWRLERGWRVCPRCATLHKTEFPLCPICRLCG